MCGLGRSTIYAIGCKEVHNPRVDKLALKFLFFALAARKWRSCPSSSTTGCGSGNPTKWCGTHVPPRLRRKNFRAVAKSPRDPHGSTHPNPLLVCLLQSTITSTLEAGSCPYLNMLQTRWSPPCIKQWTDGAPLGAREKHEHTNGRAHGFESMWVRSDMWASGNTVCCLRRVQQSEINGSRGREHDDKFQRECGGHSWPQFR